MAQRKKTTRKRRRSSKTKQQHRLVDNLLGIIVSLVMLVGLFKLGALGMFVLNCFKLLVGESADVAMVFVLLLGLCFTFYARWPRLKWRWVVGGLITYAGALIWLHALMFRHLNLHANYTAVTWNHLSKMLFNGDASTAVGGGMLGAYLYSGSTALVSQTGSMYLAWILIVVGIIIFFSLPWRSFLIMVGQWLQKVPVLINHMKERTSGLQLQTKPTTLPHHEPTINTPVASSSPASPNTPAQSAGQEPNIQVATASEVPSSNNSSSLEQADSAGADNDDEPALELATDSSVDDDYQLPPLSLLTKVPATDQQADLNSIKTNTKKLQDTLKSFGVDATVENVNLGPSVTKYELRPAVGVKVSRITHLADDLALALAAKDIRIEAPIPGKSLIGIEVPNQTIATVGFRDMIEVMPKDDHPMNVPLGRTVTGGVMMADLTKMPHLLIAGATGSGKSVAINVIITSILMKAKPHQVKFLMIDPKKVELSVYNGIPHLLSPVVSDPKKAARALGKVVAEMERRYELFAKFGIRNIKGYNQLVQKNNTDSSKDPQPSLPLILVIVDELSDLMMTVSHDVEDAIVRIAQMGRAAGIHMILATQRPSVDVITGLIKANVPSRIAFAVSSGVDSRTIIDTNGAEKLLGRGDMLFEPIDKNKPVRVQGAFISDHDVEAVVDFIKKERPAEYDQTMVVTDHEMEQEEQAEDQDALFDDALAFVVDQQKASTSLIQRRFRIGYNRAARIIDDMEQRGYIGPANGSKPREVYKQKDDNQQ